MSSQIPVLINPYDCAKRGVEFEGTLLISQFKRLAEVIAVADGEFNLKLSFDVDPAYDSRLKGSIKGKIVLDCQRCLHHMEYDVDILLDHILCASHDKLEKYKNLDTIFSEEEKIHIVDLLEDEILLAIPFIAKHENIEDCQGLSQYIQKQDEQDTVLEKADNPFAILKDKLH